MRGSSGARSVNVSRTLLFLCRCGLWSKLIDNSCCCCVPARNKATSVHCCCFYCRTGSAGERETEIKSNTRDTKGNDCVREETLMCCSAFRSFSIASKTRSSSCSAALITWPAADRSLCRGSSGPVPTDGCCFDSVLVMEQRAEPEDRARCPACCRGRGSR